jgi:ornithine cyclodeaminase
MEIRILNEQEIWNCVEMDEAALEAVAEGFSKLTEGKVTLPPIMRIDIHENNGEVDVKTAYVQGMDSFALKIASGFHDNRLKGLPTGSGMMILISAETGRPEAVLLDNGYLTEVRTGLAGAIAARHLAKSEISTVGVIGSGMQARYQMRALKLVRDYKKLYVFGIVPEEVDQYSQEMAQQLELEVIQADDPETVVRESEVVVTTTPSRDPYLRAEWLHPGLHITCMGSDAEYKQELHPEVFKQADIVVCDRRSQVFRLGELHHAKDAGIITRDEQVIELGELTLGVISGRETEEQITVCDLTGVGVQDTQIARLAYKESIRNGLGIVI